MPLSKKGKGKKPDLIKKEIQRIEGSRKTYSPFGEFPGESAARRRKLAEDRAQKERSDAKPSGVLQKREYLKKHSGTGGLVSSRARGKPVTAATVPKVNIFKKRTQIEPSMFRKVGSTICEQVERETLGRARAPPAVSFSHALLDSPFCRFAC